MVLITYIGLGKKVERKIENISFPSVIAYVLGAQKNRLDETVHYFEYPQHMFWLRNKKIKF